MSFRMVKSYHTGTDIVPEGVFIRQQI